MGDTMKAVDIKGGKGPKENLFINADTPKPRPGDGEVLVQIKAFGINRMDQIQRLGDYPLPPQAPQTLGVEFSGTVETLGRGLMAHSKKGTKFSVWHMEVAGFPEALLVVGEFAAGKTVLWHAGVSGVSIAGIQLAKKAGASAIYATAGSQAKCDFVVNELGATAAFNYKTDDWVECIKEATGGKGVDIIVDFVGGSYFQKNIDVAARDARIVALGLLGGGKIEGAEMDQLLYKRLRIEGSTLRSRDVDYQGNLRDRLEEYIPHFETGKLKVVIDTVLSWEEIQKAHGILENNANAGKIICTIP